MESTAIRTNQDLYIYAWNMVCRREEHSRSLPDWIAVFHSLLEPWAKEEAVPVADFASALDRAFDLPVRSIALGVTPVADFFSQQEAELRRGEASGSFDDPYRYFGSQIPDGGYWYNWSPQAYIECGIAGAFGARSFDVEDGEQADVSGDAKLTEAEEVSRRLAALAGTDKPSALPELTWEQIQHFGVCGQSYE